MGGTPCSSDAFDPVFLWIDSQQTLESEGVREFCPLVKWKRRSRVGAAAMGMELGGGGAEKSRTEDGRKTNGGRSPDAGGKREPSQRRSATQSAVRGNPRSEKGRWQKKGRGMLGRVRIKVHLGCMNNSGWGESMVLPKKFAHTSITSAFSREYMCATCPCP